MDEELQTLKLIFLSCCVLLNLSCYSLQNRIDRSQGNEYISNFCMLIEAKTKIEINFGRTAYMEMKYALMKDDESTNSEDYSEEDDADSILQVQREQSNHA